MGTEAGDAPASHNDSRFSSHPEPEPVEGSKGHWQPCDETEQEALRLDFRTLIYDILQVNGNELLKKLRKVAREKGISLDRVKSHGKGSHGTLYFGDKKVPMKDLKKEIGPGLLNAVLEKIGLTKDDIE